MSTEQSKAYVIMCGLTGNVKDLAAKLGGDQVLKDIISKIMVYDNLESQL